MENPHTFTQITLHYDPRENYTLSEMGFLYLEGEKSFCKCFPSIWFFTTIKPNGLLCKRNHLKSNVASFLLLYPTKGLLKDNSTPWGEGENVSLSYYESYQIITTVCRNENIKEKLSESNAVGCCLHPRKQ